LQTPFCGNFLNFNADFPHFQINFKLWKPSILWNFIQNENHSSPWEIHAADLWINKIDLLINLSNPIQSHNSRTWHICCHLVNRCIIQCPLVCVWRSVVLRDVLVQSGALWLLPSGGNHGNSSVP
jgi:hypothetical protein